MKSLCVGQVLTKLKDLAVLTSSESALSTSMASTSQAALMFRGKWHGVFFYELCGSKGPAIGIGRNGAHCREEMRCSAQVIFDCETVTSKGYCSSRLLKGLIGTSVV